jgi:hypothetical protein
VAVADTQVTTERFLVDTAAAVLVLQLTVAETLLVRLVQ